MPSLPTLPRLAKRRHCAARRVEPLAGDPPKRVTLVEEVRADIERRHLLERGERVVVAVSGGLDSMVLLRLLDGLAADFGWSLFVAHFNHSLRGAESDRDEALVRVVAGQLGWPCAVGWGDRSLRVRRRGESLEMAARAARHRFLAESAAQCGARNIALGQHADDQFESVLMRLFRGAGGEGLAGMKWVGPSPANAALTLVRPLLGQTRAALRAYAEESNLRWREDSTNACLDMTRNWLRREVIPRLRRRFGPGLIANVVRTAELVGAESEAVSVLAQTWRNARRRAAFGTLHPGLQRRVLVQELIELGIEPAFSLVEALRTQPGTSRAVAPTCSVWRDAHGRVRAADPRRTAFGQEQKSVSLSGDAGRIAFGGIAVAWRIRARRGRARVAQRPGRESFDADRVGSPIRLRCWQPGDRFTPIGRKTGGKLQDLFVNARVARDDRHRRVIAVTAGGELFWVEGLRMAQGYKITPQTRRWLEWTWSRGPGSTAESVQGGAVRTVAVGARRC